MDTKNCNTIKELMDYWKNKKPQTTTYKIKKRECGIVIDHQKNFFIPDGIVDEVAWNSLENGKKILFVLKEAYEDNHKNKGVGFK